MVTQEVGADRAFAYKAQTGTGQVLSGSINAPSAEQAQTQLAELGLYLIELEAEPAAHRGGAVRGADFTAFNEQLAQLTDAGLPVEQGLRLIAQDMRSGALASSVQKVADELAAGSELAEAFAKHRDKFPPLYSQLVEAGVRSGRLPEVLFNLGQHLELVQQLRATLWRAAAYPLIVIVVMLLLLGGMAFFVVPAFREIFEDFDMSYLPVFTMAIFALADATGWIVLGALVCIAGLVVGWAVLSKLGYGQAVLDYVVMPLPVIGKILRRNLIARWIDALRVGISAGLDLPEAIEMAGQTVGSPRAQADGQALKEVLAAGVPMDQAPRLRVIPATVPASIHLASERYDLSRMLESLAKMQHRQAELRLATLQTLMTPVALVFIGVVIGGIAGGLFLPLLALMESLM